MVTLSDNLLDGGEKMWNVIVLSGASLAFSECFHCMVLHT